MTVVIDKIEIDIIKKNIKNIHLSVMPPNGQVRLSVPFSTSDEAINIFLNVKISWIKQQIAKFEKQPRLSMREYVSGENVYLFGKRYKLKLETANIRSSTIEIVGSRIILKTRIDTTISQKERTFTEWYRKQLKDKLINLIEKWENITGFSCASWQIKQMKTRWGTYNPDKNKILFNLQLAKKSVECIEYVIIHELAHTEEKNHGKKFVAILDKYLPNWRTLKNDLNYQVLDYIK